MNFLEFIADRPLIIALVVLVLIVVAAFYIFTHIVCRLTVF